MMGKNLSQLRLTMLRSIYDRLLQKSENSLVAVVVGNQNLHNAVDQIRDKINEALKTAKQLTIQQLKKQ